MVWFRRILFSWDVLFLRLRLAISETVLQVLVQIANELLIKVQEDNRKKEDDLSVFIFPGLEWQIFLTT